MNNPLESLLVEVDWRLVRRNDGRVVYLENLTEQDAYRECEADRTLGMDSTVERRVHRVIVPEGDWEEVTPRRLSPSTESEDAPRG